jgi:hypothetical protein
MHMQSSRKQRSTQSRTLSGHAFFRACSSRSHAAENAASELHSHRGEMTALSHSEQFCFVRFQPRRASQEACTSFKTLRLVGCASSEALHAT